VTAAVDPVPAASGQCPFTVDRPIMSQRWERLTFLHWAYEPAAVGRLLPPGLTAETFDGAAWVSLVPFFMHVRTARGATAPWASFFPETNVRTYVRDAHGRPGIWFFSLDAARLGAVVVARTTYRLPYFWSSLRIDEDPVAGTTAYACRRRWPGGRGPTGSVGASSRVVVRPRERIAAADARDHFLTARFRLFSPVRAGAPRSARAWHEPWPLHRADLLVCDDALLPAAGLPAPSGVPLVHYSPGVDVRIGRPEA